MSKSGIPVKLIGEDSNAFVIIGIVCRELRRGGRSDLIEEFQKEATSGDYDHLLAVVQDYVDVS